MRRVGLPARPVTLVHDNLQEIAAVIQATLSHVERVIRSGGCGATGDDLTREAIAQATDCPLEFHQLQLELLRRWLESLDPVAAQP